MHTMQTHLFAINHSAVMIFAKLKPGNIETYSICGNITLSIKKDKKMFAKPEFIKFVNIFFCK